VPWQQAAARHGLTLSFVKITPAGEIDLENLRAQLSPRTKIVSLSHCSNVLGTITPLALVKKILSEQGSDALLIADACQSVPHFPVSVADLGVDFLVFSSHKVYGPSGVGVLWGRAPLLEQLPPYQTGGDMVQTVTPTTATWQPVPGKFEAGTPNLEGVIGLGAAIRYLQTIGMENVAAHTAQLTSWLLAQFSELPEVTLLGQPHPESGIVSFTVTGIHPHDVAEMFAELNICIRAGHHCVAPLHAQLGIAASSRISIGLYTEQSDLEKAVEALKNCIQKFNV